MNLKIEEMKNLRVAYCRSVGPYGEENYNTMKKIKSWAKDNSLINDELIILGIAEDDPEVIKPEECRYDACAVIDDDYDLIGHSVNDGKIQGGKYAVFKIDHTVEAVQKAWSSIFDELINHRYIFDKTRPTIERYRIVMVKDGYCEICVPIK